jgi:hypothetical protein
VRCAEDPQPDYVGVHPMTCPIEVPLRRRLTLRSTGPAGSCFDLRSRSARRAGYLQR